MHFPDMISLVRPNQLVASDIPWATVYLHALPLLSSEADWGAWVRIVSWRNRERCQYAPS